MRQGGLLAGFGLIGLAVEVHSVGELASDIARGVLDIVDQGVVVVVQVLIVAREQATDGHFDIPIDACF